MLRSLTPWAITVASLLVALGGVALATNTFSEKESLNLTRPCIPVDGHTTQLSVSSSAGSGDLGEMVSWTMVCTVDVYWETGDSSNPTADSNSDWLPAGTIIKRSTGHGNQSRYVAAVDTASASGTCYIHKCE